MRTDNGTEFCNADFDSLCAESGIRRHNTVPYTPQQNGIAERMNRTLLERVRAMLVTSGLPKLFWGEAILTACYLINGSPSVPLNGKLPEFVWCGKDVSLSNLRVFGCTAFVHQKLDKLSPRSMKCVFLVYPEGVKGYRLWVKEEHGFKTIISRDVVFNESEFPCLSISESEVSGSTPNKVEPLKPVSVSESSAETDVQETEPIEHAEVFDQNVESELPTIDDISDYQLARDRPRRDNIRLP